MYPQLSPLHPHYISMISPSIGCFKNPTRKTKKRCLGTCEAGRAALPRPPKAKLHSPTTIGNLRRSNVKTKWLLYGEYIVQYC